MTWLSLLGRSAGLLVVTPFVLRFFSPAQTSLWLLFLTVSSLLMIADLGFGPSFVRAVSYARAGRRSLGVDDGLLGSPNTVLLRGIFRALQSSYRRLTLAGALVGCVLGSWSLAGPINQLSAPEEGWIAWACVLSSALLVFRNSAYTNWLLGLNLVAQLRRKEAIIALSSVPLTASVVILTENFLWSVLVAQAGLVLTSFVIRRLAISAADQSFGEPESSASTEVFAFVWPAAWRSGIGVLACSATIQALGLIYAQVAPAAEVAPYLLAMRIIQVIVQVSMVPFYSHIPRFAAMYASDQREELLTAVCVAMAKAHWLYIVGVLAVAVAAQPLLEVLGSQVGFVSSQLWLLMGMAFFLERFGAMHLQFYSLSNHILWHVVNGVSGVIILITSILLFPICGASAFPLGMIVGYAGFYSWFSAHLVYRHYQQHPWHFELRTSALPALALLLGWLVTITV